VGSNLYTLRHIQVTTEQDFPPSCSTTPNSAAHKQPHAPLPSSITLIGPNRTLACADTRPASQVVPTLGLRGHILNRRLSEGAIASHTSNAYH